MDKSEIQFSSSRFIKFNFKLIFQDESPAVLVDQDVLSNFAILSATIISSKGSSLNRGSVSLAWKSGKILMKFLLEKMTTTTGEEDGGAVVTILLKLRLFRNNSLTVSHQTVNHLALFIARDVSSFNSGKWQCIW
jgi:hypothetical protein